MLLVLSGPAARIQDCIAVKTADLASVVLCDRWCSRNDSIEDIEGAHRGRSMPGRPLNAKSSKLQVSTTQPDVVHGRPDINFKSRYAQVHTAQPVDLDGAVVA